MTDEEIRIIASDFAIKFVGTNKTSYHPAAHIINVAKMFEEYIRGTENDTSNSTNTIQ